MMPCRRAQPSSTARGTTPQVASYVICGPPSAFLGSEKRRKNQFNRQHSVDLVQIIVSSGCVARDRSCKRRLIEEVSTMCRGAQQSLPNEVGKVRLDPDPVTLELLPPCQNPLEPQLLQF